MASFSPPVSPPVPLRSTLTDGGGARRKTDEAAREAEREGARREGLHQVSDRESAEHHQVDQGIWGLQLAGAPIRHKARDRR